MLDYMRLADVLTVLRTLAPETLAEPWDKVGLHAGDVDQPVRKAMLCIDLTEAVLEEALAGKMDLVVAYHPPIFEPLEHVTTDETKSRIIYRAVRAGMAIYSPHTALDAAPGGVNDWLTAGLGAGRVEVIRPAAQRESYKLVTFVPHDAADAVRLAMTDAGAGRIGDYTACSFGVDGEGTFKGGNATNPTVGRRGRFERVAELRMEMLVSAGALSEVIAALREVHPYEEPAFDVYRLEGDSAKPHAAVDGAGGGQGRVVTLDEAVSLDELASRVMKRLKVKHLEVVKAERGKVRRIGLCAGAGGSLMSEAGEIDVFLTGEMRHHDQLAAAANGVSVLLAGHTQTERPYLPVYRKRIKAAGGGGSGSGAVTWAVSRKDRAPSAFVTG